jgi:hypothetical protein
MLSEEIFRLEVLDEFVVTVPRVVVDAHTLPYCIHGNRPIVLSN